MQAYLQTVSVTRPGTPLTFTAELMRPVPPLAMQRTLLEKGQPVGLLKADGTVIQWWLDSFIKVFKADGTTYVFWSKPTKANAVGYCMANRSDSAFFQFFPDGSVASRCFGSNNYWGPPVEAVPEEGKELHAQYISEEDSWQLCDSGQCEACVTTCSRDGGVDCIFCEQNDDVRYGRRYDYDTDDYSDRCRCYGRYCSDCWPDGYCDDRY